MPDLVTWTIEDGIAVIVVDNPPVNALSPGVPDGIGSAVMQAQNHPDVRAIVIRGAGRAFIAGADIRQLELAAKGEAKRSNRLLTLLRQIEDGPKPIAAAIDGVALGGGLELAMACHWRLSTASAKVGQPEVKLGIIPGAAGTQRLPRLVGVVKAAEMCALGEPIAAKDALALGLVDAILEGSLERSAIQFVRDALGGGHIPQPTRERTEKVALDSDGQSKLAELRQLVARRSRGVLAATLAIDAVEAASRLDFDQGCDYEAELFERCLTSGQALAMMHIFFGEREVAKIPGLPKDTATIPVNRIAVIGGGTMGTGIATSYLAAGIPVRIKEADQPALDKAVATIRRNLVAISTRQGWSADDLASRQKQLEPTLTYDRFDEVDLVVEAVFENMELKKKTFRELDSATRPDCILATNTSTLSVDEIASATSRPGMVVGHHFFSPAHVMRLLEIVRGKATSPAVLATSMALAKRLRKIGVVVGNCTGFVGNRMYGPYQREAQFLVEEGATPQQVDRAMTDFGMAMGPLAVGDLAGLDVGWRIRKEHAHLVPEGWRQPRISDRLCELGRFGQKTGNGWYRYSPDNRKPTPDPEVDAIVATLRKEQGITPRPISDDEIRERLLLALIVEGARILEEGFAFRPVDIDVIYVHGYGFPAFRGGPMFHADTLGMKHVHDRALQFQQTQGPWWKPPRLLADLAERGLPISQWTEPLK